MMEIAAAVLTISDSASRGEMGDLSGPAVMKVLEENGFHVVSREVVPDEAPQISAGLMRLAARAQLVVSTGGTGIAPRDVTPEATTAICDRIIPGVAELMRSEGLKQTPNASLSRAVCGSRGQTLILNLPGSPKGAVESLQSVLHLLPHMLDLLAGKTKHSV